MDPATTETYTLSLHDALPIYLQVSVKREGEGSGNGRGGHDQDVRGGLPRGFVPQRDPLPDTEAMLLVDHHHAQRSEEHTSELQSRLHLVCRLLLEKKKLQAAR